MTEASFTTDKQDLFKKSIATAAAVSVADVNIDKIATIIGGRRLLAESIRVDTRVTASSEAAAKAIARALTADKMNAELSKNNLPKATFLEAPNADVSPLQAQDEKKKDAGSGGGVLLAGILVPVLILVFVIVSMACCCWWWWRRQAPPPPPPPPPPGVVRYHGTSLEAAMNIQENGFDVKRSGKNAGASLGRGLYVTTTLQKALNYATRMDCKGVIFQLRVDLGRCYTITANDRDNGNLQTWQQMGYDSAWAAEGIIGEREETCIKDPRPPRVVIEHIILGHTEQAKSAGYWVDQGKLRKR
jgi:hypothetical protein